MAPPMAGALALMIEFREEVVVVLCMVVFACSAALVHAGSCRSAGARRVAPRRLAARPCAAMRPSE